MPENDKAMILWENLRHLKKYVSRLRAYRILKLVTLYHRIQASPGLQKAAESIEQLILEESPDSVNTELFRYTGKQGPEWLPLPTSWEIHDAQIIVGDRYYRLEAHPTMVAAHSPPSEGWVEGRVRIIEDPLDPDSYQALGDNEIPLVTSNHSLAYRIAAESNMPAIIFAFKNRREDAFPYLGLFLTEKEAQKYTTPAITLPWKEAREIEGKTIRLKIDSDIGGPGKLPVLVSWIGDRGTPGPAIIAHLCHPMPGANDNASGVASAVEAFLAITQAIEEGLLPMPEATIRLILVPEFTGTILGLEGWMKNLVPQALNLDMVGASKSLGVEPPHAYYVPVTKPDNTLVETYIEAQQLTGVLRVKYYMYGSDHDPFLAYGKESIIINQWPDPNYHSDADDANNIDPHNLEHVALLASTTIVSLAQGYTPRHKLGASIISKQILQERVKDNDYEGYRLAGFYVPLKYGIEPYTRPPETIKLKGDERLVFKGNRRLLLGQLSIVQKSLDDAIKFARYVNESKLDTSLIYGELSFAASQQELMKATYILLRAVYGRILSWERFRELIGLLEDIGILSILQ